MSSQQSPFLEAHYGWPYGSSGWNTGMDENLLKFSFLFDRNVDSIVASLPAAVNGQAHFLTTNNRLYFAVGTTYFSTPVPKWFIVVERSTGQTYQYNGTALVQIDSPAQLDTRLDAIELTVASLGSAAFSDNTDFDLFGSAAEAQAFAIQRSNHTGTQAISTVSGLQTALGGKVDKVTGKQLSTEDYTTAEKSKLSGIATGATANSTDAQLRDRATHTGTQAISTVAGLDAALGGKVDNTDSRLTNSREWIASEVSQVEAEVGTSTTARKWTAQRVRQAVLGWWNTSTFKTKLDGIEEGAQVNSVTSVAGKTGTVTLNKADVGLSNVDNTSDSNKPVSTPQQAALNLKLDANANAVSASKLATSRTISLSGDASGSTSFDGSANATIAVQVADDSHNHVISNVDGLQTALDSKVDKVVGKQLSTEDYTTAEKSKLSGIATGATANATDAQLRDRSTHTGTQAISTVTGLQGELNNRPTAAALTASSPSILIVDQLRRSVEVASGGRQTVIYTAKGQPCHMYVLPRFNCEDIAPGGELGTGTHPAFLFNGTPAQEIFIAAHLASEIAGEAISRPFADPRTSRNFDQSRALCQANGPGWDLMSNLDWAAIALWCMANGYQPRGNTDWGRHHDRRWETGRRVDTLAPGTASGTSRTLAGSGPAAWAHDGTPAGIQDLVGNVWEWVSGMKTVNGRVWLSPDNGLLSESQFVDSGFDMPTTRVFSSVPAAGASNLVKQSLIAPASASLAPLGTLYTDLTAERLPFRGGTWHESSAAGLGALHLRNARAAVSSRFGFRPRFRAL